MMLVHWLLAAANFALLFIGAYAVITVVAALFASGQADEDSTNVAKKEGWK